MGLVNVSRNAENLVGFSIDNGQDMYTVFDWASTHGYAAHMNTDANGIRTLGITNPDGTTQQSAEIGDLAVVKNDVQLNLVPKAQIGGSAGVGLYTVTPAS